MTDRTSYAGMSQIYTNTYVYSPLRQKKEIKQKKEHTDRDRQVHKTNLQYYPKKLTVLNNINKFSKHTTSINIATVTLIFTTVVHVRL